MFLRYLKNYRNCFRYLLIIMGVVYFFFLLAAFTFVSGAWGIVSGEGAAVIEKVADILTGRMSSGDIATYMSMNYWYETGNAILDVLADAGGVAVYQLALLFAGCVLLIVVGIKLSESASVYYFKREHGGKAARYGLLSWIFKFVVSVLFAVAYAAFLFLWQYGGVVVPAVYLVVNALQTLWVVWFVYFSKEERRKICGVRNVLRVALVQLCSYLVFAAVFFLLYIYVSAVLAFVIAVPFFVYTDSIVTFTAVLYFKDKLKT